MIERHEPSSVRLRDIDVRAESVNAVLSLGFYVVCGCTTAHSRETIVEVPAVRSISLVVALTVTCVVIVAWTLLPAILAILGPSVDMLSVPKDSLELVRSRIVHVVVGTSAVARTEPSLVRISIPRTSSRRTAAFMRQSMVTVLPRKVPDVN